MNGDIERLTRERDKERKHVARIMRDLGHNRTRAEKAEVAISERDRRIAELEAELIQSRNFWSDELSAKNAQLTASRAECEGLRAERKEREKRAIGNGMAIAAAIIVRIWGESTMAEEILGAAGYKTEADLIADGVDEYDIEPLRAALSQKETGA